MEYRKILFAFSFLLTTTIVAGQNDADTAFLKFAGRQTDLFVEAYNNQDLKEYDSLLTEFLNRYYHLSDAQQKYFQSYYINAYYNLSCMYSLKKNIKQGLLYLRKSVNAGYSNYTHIQEDSDLNNIRNEKDFMAIVQSLRENGDYLYILKKDNERFTADDSLEIPPFIYQSADNRDLENFRKQFNLDSIAGTGNEVSKILNILHWVHNTVPHDGQRESGIKAVNGFEIISVAKANNIGVSCGELATLLNECYLSMGFKSRKIYCKPKDSLSQDNDSHVINVVYSKQLNKWLWMDATNDAYVMNEKGELLGINVVRNKLIHDQPLIINPDANWNHRESTTKDKYLYYYMAKNLYRFYCTLESSFDIETPGKGKTIAFVYLVPAGYGKFIHVPFRSEVFDKETKATVIHYITHNPDIFWQVP
jgi:hypothetical protein